jgi:hypothetical protein
MWMMGIYVMNDHYIQKQEYNEYMNKLEKLNNINYNHSFENGSISEGVQPCNILHGCQYKINVGYGFLAGWFTKI